MVVLSSSMRGTIVRPVSRSSISRCRPSNGLHFQSRSVSIVRGECAPIAAAYPRRRIAVPEMFRAFLLCDLALYKEREISARGGRGRCSSPTARFGRSCLVGRRTFPSAEGLPPQKLRTRFHLGLCIRDRDRSPHSS